MTTAVEVPKAARTRPPLRSWRSSTSRSTTDAGGSAGQVHRRYSVHRHLLPAAVLLDGDLVLPSPDDGSEHRLLASPPSIENYTGVFGGQTTSSGRSELRRHLGLRPLLTLVFGRGRVRTGPSAVRRQGPRAELIIGASMFPGVTLLVPLFKMFTGTYVVPELAERTRRPSSVAVVRSAARGEPDSVLPAAAGRAGAGRHGRRLHPGRRSAR